MEDNYIYTTDLKIGLKLLLVEVVTFVAEIEEFYSITKDVEDKIKNKIKLMEKHLYITRYLIDDEVHNTNILDNENIDTDKFNYLDDKTILDGLIYIIYLITKIQIRIDIEDITEFTQNRIRNRLNSALKYFKDITKIYYRDGE